MRQLKFSITTDANGNGNATWVFNGFALNAYAVPGGGAVATWDFTIVAPPEAGVTPRTLLTATNVGTSAVDYPLQVQGKDATGTAISGTYLFPPVCGALTVTVSGGGNGVTYSIYVIVLDSDARDGTT